MAAIEEDDIPELVPLSLQKDDSSDQEKIREPQTSRNKVPVTIITGFLGKEREYLMINESFFVDKVLVRLHY